MPRTVLRGMPVGRMYMSASMTSAWTLPWRTTFSSRSRAFTYSFFSRSWTASASVWAAAGGLAASRQVRKSSGSRRMGRSGWWSLQIINGNRFLETAHVDVAPVGEGEFLVAADGVAHGLGDDDGLAGQAAQP